MTDIARFLATGHTGHPLQTAVEATHNRHPLSIVRTDPFTFSLYIQLVTRRDVSNGGPMQIPVLPSEGQGQMPSETQTHLPLPDDTSC